MEKNTKKSIRIYETLDSATRLSQEHTANGLRLTGVFGKCGVRNMNNRVYERKNYGDMVRMLQEEIEQNNGVMGELEHPNSMNINLNNVSHKIESIRMDEDGTVTGSILLLNTDKGRQAQAIIEGGLDLFISSRASGNVDKNGNVVLESLKTYDLVGTPGFSEARLKMCENYQPNEKVYMINENLCYVTEEEEEKDPEFNVEEPKEDPALPEPEGDDEPCDDTVISEILMRLDAIEARLDACCGENGDCESDEMNDTVRKAVEESRKWITSRYTRKIQEWLNREFMPRQRKLVLEQVSGYMDKWARKELMPGMYKKFCGKLVPRIEGWINEQLLPKVQDWICEEYGARERKLMGKMTTEWFEKEVTPELEGWMQKYFAEQINENVTNKLSEKVNGWMEKEVLPEIYNNVSDYLSEGRGASLDTVDSILEMLENPQGSPAEKAAEELDEGFAGNPALMAMPGAYRPLWNTLNESRKSDILARARVYDFSKPGVPERFWSGVDFTAQEIQVNESAEPSFYSRYENMVINGIRRFNKNN